MASNDAVILQGSFTSTGAAQTIILESGVDWMEVWNYTLTTTPAASTGYRYYWQNGMAAGDGIVDFYVATAVAGVYASSASGCLNFQGGATGAAGGFTYATNVGSAPGAPQALTAVSTAATPVVTSTPAAPATGTIVRMYNVLGAQQLGGIDFYATNTGANAFSLTYCPQLAVAGTTGTYSVIPYDPIFYPTHRFVMSISQAASAVVTTSVPHGYTTGQQVRMNVPAAYGMTQMDGLQGTVTVTNSYTFSLNINSTAFTAFAFPTSAAVPFTPATVTPFGENIVSPYGNVLSDATINTGFTGMTLGAYSGLNCGPAGANTNVMYWKAGKSFSNNGN